MFRQAAGLSKEKEKIFREFQAAIQNNEEKKFLELLAKYHDDAGILNYQQSITRKNQIYYGPTLLIEAVRLKRTSMATALLKISKVKINLQDTVPHKDPNVVGHHALLAAIYAHEEELAGLLLDKPQCDVNVFTGANLTVLISAVLYLPAILPKLFSHKLLRVNDQDATGKTALHHACLRHNPLSQSLLVPPYLQILIQHGGVDLDMADVNGFTALMIVAARGDNLIAEALVRVGANPGCVDKSGRNAGQIAKEKGYHHLASLLAPSCVQLTESGRNVCTF